MDLVVRIHKASAAGTSAKFGGGNAEMARGPVTRKGAISPFLGKRGGARPIDCYAAFPPDFTTVSKREADQFLRGERTEHNARDGLARMGRVLHHKSDSTSIPWLQKLK